MLKQIMNIFRPTRYKIVASIGFTLVYIVAAFVRIVSAGLLLGSSVIQSFSHILLVVVNWIVLAALLYVTSFFVLSKDRLPEYSLKRRSVLMFVTVLGLLVSQLFSDMPRFLSLIFTSLATDGGAGSFVLIVMAELLLSYVLFSLFMSFMEKLKN